MNRDRQMKKDIENKQAQAREEYAKNKPLYSENKIMEKAEGNIHHDQNNTEKNKDENASNNENTSNNLHSDKEVI